MRLFALSLLLPLLVGDVCFAQTIDVTSSRKTGFPVYRPALLGTGPTALINRIDTQDLINKGQKDGAVMFTCSVKKTGEVVWSATYRGTPDSKLLEKELQKKLADATFIPAIYNRALVDAVYYGTVTFAIIDGKPRLRIFSNQEAEELKKESDFVGPQLFFGNESQFTGWHYPPPSDTPVMMDGSVDLKMQIDDKGNVQRAAVVAEEPPFLGFAGAALRDISKARFIPAFRGGKPVACDIDLPVYYTRPN
jgi:hypothetical protein